MTVISPKHFVDIGDYGVTYQEWTYGEYEDTTTDQMVMALVVRNITQLTVGPSRMTIDVRSLPISHVREIVQGVLHDLAPLEQESG